MGRRKRGKLRRRHYFLFNIQFHGIDIFDEKQLFGHSVPSSQVSYSEEFDWIDAAHADNMSWWEFMEKPSWYRGMLIAHHRGKTQIEAVLAEDMRIKDEHRRAQDEALRMSGAR